MTARDKQVLQLLADGYESKDIAPKLGITLRSFNNLVLRIYARANAYNRAHAVAIALRKGMIR